MPKFEETVVRMVELAGMARKDGMMALEGQPVRIHSLKEGCKCWLMELTSRSS